jgi:hypothetical protein
MPQRIRDYGVAALVLVALFVVLTRVDGRVPARVTQAIADVANGQWIAGGSPVGELMMSVSASPAVTNVFVAALLAAGVVLVFLMVRT